MPKIFSLTRGAVVVAAALAIASMLCYPGGTPLDATTSHYDIIQNFLSDLGMTVSYGGHSNRLGATLFIASVSIIVLALGVCLVIFVRTLARTPAARRLMRLAALIGTLACVALIGVAATPENRMMGLHIEFTRWAFRAFPIVTILFAFATLSDTRFRRRAAAGWILLTLALAVYVAVMQWGPAMTSASALATHVIAQKLIVLIGLVGLGFETFELERALARSPAPREG